MHDLPYLYRITRDSKIICLHFKIRWDVGNRFALIPVLSISILINTLFRLCFIMQFSNNDQRNTILDSMLHSLQHSPIHSDQEIDIGYYNELRAVLAGDDTEEDPTEFVNGCFNDDPYYNINGETTHNIFNDRSMAISSKRAYFQDGPSSSDTDTEAANGPVKRLRVILHQPRCLSNSHH